MEPLNSTFIAQIFNFLVFFLLVYFIYKLYRRASTKEKICRQQEEIIIGKLDHLIELSNKQLEYLSKK